MVLKALSAKKMVFYELSPSVPRNYENLYKPHKISHLHRKRFSSSPLKTIFTFIYIYL